MRDFVVEVRDLTFSYNGKPVLDRVSFQVPHGEFLALLGPNGGGKTTLVKLLLGLLSPQQGEIRVLGEIPSKAVARVGYVAQDSNFNHEFPISVKDVVLMGRFGIRSGASEDGEAVERALEQVGLSAFRDVRIGEISQGQRQRVLVARALVTEPEMLVLDEPMASIDQGAQARLYEVLKKLNEKVTILMVSHDLTSVSTYATAVACVNRNVYYHDSGELTAESFEAVWGACPVDLIAHGIPHRVLRHHREQGEELDCDGNSSL